MVTKERLKKIKLVVFDLDGTLLNNEGMIGEESLQLTEELKKFGVSFSFATGRLHSAVSAYVEEMKIDIPIISLDGALIQKDTDTKPIHKTFIKPKYVKKALKLADKYFLKIALCHPSAIYYTEDNSTIPDVLDKFGAVYKPVYSYEHYLNEVLEIVMTSDYGDYVKHVSQKLIFPYTFGLQTSYYKSNSKGGIYYLEVRNLGSSKGNRLKKLCKHLKIKEKEAAVIGDWHNDKSLFETDALKIAVANAVPELKKMADMVTKRTNDEDGTADFLRILLKAKET